MARASILPIVLVALSAAVPTRGADEACLVGEVLIHGREMDWLRQLADGIGSRLSGSPGGRRAEEAMAAEMRGLKLENVRREPFEMKASWQRGTATAELLGPVARPLRVASYMWTRGSAGVIEGDLLDLGAGSSAEVKAAGDRLRDKVALVELPGGTIDRLIESFYRLEPLAREVAAAGGKALLVTADKEHGLLFTAPVLFGEAVTDLATASIAREDAALLRRLAGAGGGAATPIRLRLQIENQLGPAFEASNVVGEITGREKPEEIVVVGAHLDSVDLGAGALDNAAGVGAVLEAARAIRALGLSPRRTIRFVLFMGEEEGCLGSAAYVRRHRDEMGRTVAALVMDVGAGRPLGWFSMGRSDLDPAIARTMAPLAALGMGVIEHVAFAATDNAPFMAAGVPNLVLIQDDAPYLPVHHSVADTAERAEPRDFAASAAVLAATAYSIADAPERFGPRLTVDEVKKMAAETRVEAQWRAIALWPLVELAR